MNSAQVSSQHALVTGATGFIGGNLTRTLLDQGWKVSCLVRSGSDCSRLLEGADLIVYDQQIGAQALADLLRERKPVVVFHLASRFLAAHTPDDIPNLVASNIQFGAELLEAMTLSQTSLLVNTGTSWQHYESRAYSPVNLYAATKQAFEDLLQYYVEAGGLRCITLKLFDTYGPNDPRPKLFHLLSRVAASSENLAMSPGEQLIDLVHIDDVIRAFFRAAQRLLAGEVVSSEAYAISSGRPIPLRDLVAIYAQVTGRRLNIEWGGRPYRTREVMVPWSTGPTLPGWHPAVPLEEGIRRLLAAED